MQTVESGFWPVAGSRIGVTLSSSSSWRLSSAGIGSVGRRIGDGDLYVPVKQDVERPTRKPDNSLVAWLKRTRCGGNVEFRRSWRALAFESARVPSPSTCGVATAEHPHQAGGSS